jgi:hypothetical protein
MLERAVDKGDREIFTGAGFSTDERRKNISNMLDEPRNPDSIT